MPKAYLVAHVRVHDAERYEEFRRLSGPAIASHGGRVLARDPAPDHREGAARGIAILIEFDGVEAARAFYESDAYTALRKIREAAAETDLMLVEGI